MTTPAFSLTIDLAPSRLLFTLQWAAHGLAGASLLLLQISFSWLAIGWLLIALHGVWMWQKTAWLRQLKQLIYRDGLYLLVTAQGQELEAMGSGHYVMPWLTILDLTFDGRQKYLPLLMDSADSNSLRRLRVLLRCQSSEPLNY